MLGAYNVTAATRPVPVDVLRSLGLDHHAYDHLSSGPLASDGDAVLLPPYAAAWLTAA
jgi:hypothetical protein